MVQERSTIIEEDAEFVNGALHIPVHIDQFEEEYVGTDRGEEYYEEVDIGDEVITVECPVTNVYKNSDPSEEYSSSNAVQFIQNNSWSSIDIADLETVELQKEGELFIASVDSSELDQYREY